MKTTHNTPEREASIVKALRSWTRTNTDDDGLVSLDAFAKSSEARRAEVSGWEPEDVRRVMSDFCNGFIED